MAARSMLGLALAAMIALPLSAQTRITPLGFEDLQGWDADNHAAALRAFQRSCDVSATSDRVADVDWEGLCIAAANAISPKTFFEVAFQPVLIEDGEDALFTGYYEPELEASRVRTGRFQYPLYRRPQEAQNRSSPWLTRAEIEAGALAGRGLELAWLSDPVDAFFLHVQGSGRLAMQDGSVMRVGYGGRNGHTYRSVGRHMADSGLLPSNAVSAQRIKSWVRDNGAAGRAVLNHNPSYIFFTVNDGLSPTDGPIGAMSIPVTPRRSIAVDSAYTPLGLPVWLETETSEGVFNHLMIAQDVGAAINGAQRADIFFGAGAAAYSVAGRQRYGGRMVTLIPRTTLAPSES